MKRAVPPRRKRIRPYIPGPLYARLYAHRTAKGIAVSDIVEKAVREHLDGVNDLKLLLEKLDRISRGVNRLRRDLGMFLEIFGGWLRVWYASAPTIEPAQRAEAWKKAGGRLRDLLRAVRSRMKTDESFAAAFAEEFAADDPEPPAKPPGTRGSATDQEEP